MQRTANATNKHYSLNKNRIFSKPTVFSFFRANRNTQPLSKYYLCRYYHLIKTQPQQREPPEGRSVVQQHTSRAG